MLTADEICERVKSKNEFKIVMPDDVLTLIAALTEQSATIALLREEVKASEKRNLLLTSKNYDKDSEIARLMGPDEYAKCEANRQIAIQMVDAMLETCNDPEGEYAQWQADRDMEESDYYRAAMCLVRQTEARSAQVALLREVLAR